VTYRVTRRKADSTRPPRAPAPAGHFKATLLCGASPTASVAALTKLAFKAAQYPEAVDSRRHFQATNKTYDAEISRLIDGNVCVGPDRERSDRTGEDGLLAV
jgi:hypothetical protein